MSVSNGFVQVYGPHPEVADYGKICGDRWSAWKKCDVIVHRTSTGLSMQVAGLDAFLELPLISMTGNEFENLPVINRIPLSEISEFLDSPPLFTGDADREWELERIWAENCGYGMNWFPVGKQFNLDIEITENKQGVYACLTSLAEEPFGIVFNPNEFNGFLVVAGVGNKGKIIHCLPSSEPTFKMIYPNDVVKYVIPFNDVDTPFEDLVDLKSNDVVFAQMNVEVPRGVIISECVKNKGSSAKSVGK